MMPKIKAFQPPVLRARIPGIPGVRFTHDVTVWVDGPGGFGLEAAGALVVLSVTPAPAHRCGEGGNEPDVSREQDRALSGARREERG